MILKCPFLWPLIWMYEFLDWVKAPRCCWQLQYRTSTSTCNSTSTINTIAISGDKNVHARKKLLVQQINRWKGTNSYEMNNSSMPTYQIIDTNGCPEIICERQTCSRCLKTQVCEKNAERCDICVAGCLERTPVCGSCEFLAVGGTYVTPRGATCTKKECR